MVIHSCENVPEGRLFVAEGFDGVEAGGFPGGVEAEDDADDGGDGDGGDDGLDVCVRENQVVFRSGGATLSSRLIDGQFPNYRQLLPDAFEHELRLPVPDLLDVVRRISLMAQKNAPVRLGFTDGELTVSAKTPDIGEAREMLPAPFQGEPLEIGFNAEFLRDGLDSVGADGDVILKLISPLRPGLIETAEGTGFLYLIMPIRLNV